MEYLIGASIGLSTVSNVVSSIFGHKSNKRANQIQQQQLELQRKELERQRKLEEEQKKRENMQLMNSVTNLTNTSFGGETSPSIAYDKYGDLG